MKPEPAGRPFITTLEQTYAIVGATPQLSSKAAGTSNYTILSPIYIPATMLVKKLGIYNGATATGNIQLGIYNRVLQKPNALLTSAPVVAQNGANEWQGVALSQDFWLPAGQYFLAILFTSATATYISGNGPSNVMIYTGSYECYAPSSALPANLRMVEFPSYNSAILAVSGVA